MVLWRLQSGGWPGLRSSNGLTGVATLLPRRLVDVIGKLVLASETGISSSPQGPLQRAHAMAAGFRGHD